MKRYSDEWFAMIRTWEGEHSDMVQEYHCLLEYREVQERLEQYSSDVKHRIFSGA
jgi:hypothetical protein